MSLNIFKQLAQDIEDLTDRIFIIKLKIPSEFAEYSLRELMLIVLL